MKQFFYNIGQQRGRWNTFYFFDWLQSSHNAPQRILLAGYKHATINWATVERNASSGFSNCQWKSHFFESKWIFFNKVKLLDENVAKQSQSTQVLVKKIRLLKVKDQKLRGFCCWKWCSQCRVQCNYCRRRTPGNLHSCRGPPPHCSFFDGL